MTAQRQILALFIASEDNVGVPPPGDPEEAIRAILLLSHALSPSEADTVLATLQAAGLLTAGPIPSVTALGRWGLEAFDAL